VFGFLRTPYLGVSAWLAPNQIAAWFPTKLIASLNNDDLPSVSCGDGDRWIGLDSPPCSRLPAVSAADLCPPFYWGRLDCAAPSRLKTHGDARIFRGRATPRVRRRICARLGRLCRSLVTSSILIYLASIHVFATSNPPFSRSLLTHTPPLVASPAGRSLHHHHAPRLGHGCALLLHGRDAWLFWDVHPDTELPRGDTSSYLSRRFPFFPGSFC